MMLMTVLLKNASGNIPAWFILSRASCAYLSMVDSVSCPSEETKHRCPKCCHHVHAKDPTAFEKRHTHTHTRTHTHTHTCTIKILTSTDTFAVFLIGSLLFCFGFCACFVFVFCSNLWILCWWRAVPKMFFSSFLKLLLCHLLPSEYFSALQSLSCNFRNDPFQTFNWRVSCMFGVLNCFVKYLYYSSQELFHRQYCTQTLQLALSSIQLCMSNTCVNFSVSIFSTTCCVFVKYRHWMKWVLVCTESIRYHGILCTW